MPVLVLLFICTLVVTEALHSSDVKMFLMNKLVTPGTASFGVRTVTYNGNYAPRNAGVIWVTDSNNQFVKTIKLWALSYRYTLIRWIASSNQNTTGTISSASLNNHQLHNVQWDGNNWQNNPMPDGEYKFNIEFTEHNATATNLGKYKQMSFVKGSDPVVLEIPNETYFRDMSLSWQPVVSDGTISGRVTDNANVPIAGANINAGDNTATTNISGDYSISLVPGVYTVSCTATNYTPYVIDNVNVVSGQNTVLNLILAPVSLIDPSLISSVILLAPPYPNPTKSGCKISFFTGNSGNYELAVYNSRGQRVRRIDGFVSDSSWVNEVWDGKDSSNRDCPSGLYFIQLRKGTSYQIQKITLTH